MRRAAAIRGRLVAFAALAAAAAAGACADPVHDETVLSLGPEQPGVPPGPAHRPGQPCIACHGGSGPASLQLSVGGTVYAHRNDTSVPAVGAVVQIEDVDGKTYTVATNRAGNFFAPLSQFAPHYPTQMTVSSPDGTMVQGMTTLDNRAGSCAECHTPVEGPTSPGPIYLSQTAADGGT